MAIRAPEVIPFLAGGTVNAKTIVKIGAADETVIVAAAATDKVLGVACLPDGGSAASGDRLDVAVGGIYEVIAGGTVARGDLLTSDASGKAVTAAPVAGTNNYVIGRALMSGVSNDVIAVLLIPSSFQG